MTNKRDWERFQLALASPNPAIALYELAKTLKAEGIAQVAMYHLFVDFQQKLDGGDPCYDAVVDNMDLIWGGGWAKGRALFETELTNADIAEPGAAADGGGT